MGSVKFVLVFCGFDAVGEEDTEGSLGWLDSGSFGLLVGFVGLVP